MSSSGSSLGTLTLSEQSAWIATRRTALQKKQARELAYLDRRAARGTHTPTDDAYEEDQVLEQDLFEALDLLEQLLQQGQSPALGSDASLQLAYPDPDKITP